MIQRKLQILDDESVFLFGARQTGKTTLLMQQFPDALYYDLLDTDLFGRLKRKPSLLREMLDGKPEGTLVIIDEIQQIPELLNEVHLMINRSGFRFILCGSSARKLRREGVNTLGGRAVPQYLYPFVSSEIDDFDIDIALSNGMMPRCYLSKNPYNVLKAYVSVYLKEEIQAESLVRNLNSFSRFLEVAALTDGEMVNYQNIAQDCGVAANTVKDYFRILEDTLLGFFVPAYAKAMKRKTVQAPKFYLFDVGVVNYILGRRELRRGTVEYGHAFEHFVMQELVAYLSYTDNRNRLSYWRTYSQQEVDVILGDALVAIEIKSAEEIMSKHLKGLKAFRQEFPEARLMVVALDKLTRNSDGIEIVNIYDFLKMLWQGLIV